MITKVKESYCPECGKKLNRALSEKEVEPKPGDLCVCLFCTSILFYNGILELEKLSALAFNTLSDDVQKYLVNIQNDIRKGRKRVTPEKKDFPEPPFRNFIP